MRDGDRRIASRRASAKSRSSLWRICRMEERVAPALLDDFARNGSGMAKSRPRWLPSGRKRCVKADSPTPASLSQGCTSDPTVDRRNGSACKGADRFSRNCASPPAWRSLAPQDGLSREWEDNDIYRDIVLQRSRTLKAPYPVFLPVPALDNKPFH